MRTGVLVAEASKRKQMREQEHLKKEKEMILRAFTPGVLGQILRDKRGLITDYIGKPIKINNSYTIDNNSRGQMARIDFRIPDPVLTFEASKFILKQHFKRTNTEEALHEYDAMKRQERKQEKVPSYLGIGDPKKKMKQISPLDIAAKNIKDHHVKTKKHEPSPIKINSS